MCVFLLERSMIARKDLTSMFQKQALSQGFGSFITKLSFELELLALVLKSNGQMSFDSSSLWHDGSTDSRTAGDDVAARLRSGAAKHRASKGESSMEKLKESELAADSREDMLLLHQLSTSFA